MEGHRPTSLYLGGATLRLFPLYVTFAISVKSNKQFNNQPFSPLSLSGFVETIERKPAAVDAYDTKETILVREALEAGLQPGDAGWPVVRLSTKDTWHWENWIVAWDTVGTYIFNTVLVAVTAVVFALCFSTAAAFSLRATECRAPLFCGTFSWC